MHKKIIYFGRRTPYLAQKGDADGAVSCRAFYLFGVRSSELDAYRDWIDRGLHSFRLADARSNLAFRIAVNRGVQHVEARA